MKHASFALSSIVLAALMTSSAFAGPTTGSGSSGSETVYQNGSRSEAALAAFLNAARTVQSVVAESLTTEGTSRDADLNSVYLSLDALQVFAVSLQAAPSAAGMSELALHRALPVVQAITDLRMSHEFPADVVLALQDANAALMKASSDVNVAAVADLLGR